MSHVSLPRNQFTYVSVYDMCITKLRRSQSLSGRQIFNLNSVQFSFVGFHPRNNHRVLL